jgi:hypothetical protein
MEQQRNLTDIFCEFSYLPTIAEHFIVAVSANKYWNHNKETNILNIVMGDKHAHKPPYHTAPFCEFTE